MMMSKEQRPNKPYDLSLVSISRGFSLVLLPMTAYVLAVFPLIFSLFTILRYIPFTGILYYVILSILLVLAFFILLILVSFIPGLFIRVFRIKVPEGTYELSINDKAFFLHMLFFVLYRPSLTFIGIVPLVPLRLRLLKLVGLQIGQGSLIAGTEMIDEPYAVSIGDNTLIGGLSTIFSHISDTKLRMKPVRIGSNCFIGNKSVIMPGAIIEDEVRVEPNTVVIQDQILKKGKTYYGNPAMEMKK
jgi:hypothetical protein